MAIDPFFGSVVDGLFSLGSTALNNRYSRQLAEYQNAFNLEMWNKNNEYNSPQQTINRLVQAGVNPRAYNQLGQFANAADAPQAASYNRRSGLSAFSDIFQTAMQMEALRANKEKAVAEADKAKADAERSRAQTNILSKDNETYYQKFGWKAEEAEDRRIREEIYRRERGLKYRNNWFDLSDGQSIFSKQGFIDYLEDVKKTRYYNTLSEKEKYDLRRYENQLKRMELDSLSYIPKQYRWIIDKLVDVVGLPMFNPKNKRR